MKNIEPKHLSNLAIFCFLVWGFELIKATFIQSGNSGDFLTFLSGRNIIWLVMGIVLIVLKQVLFKK